MWSTESFIVGLMVGLIIMFLIMWLTYNSRTFIFSLCPVSRPTCTLSQYVNDPGVALATGAKIEDILFINDNERMYYRRERAVPDCIPKGVDQVVEITHPQFCQFYFPDGTPVEGQLYDPVGLYQIPTEDGPASVEALQFCKVSYSGSSGVVEGRGRPLLKWTKSIF